MKGTKEILAKLPFDMGREISDIVGKYDFPLEEIRIKVGTPIMLISEGREYRLKGKYGSPVESKLINDIFSSITDHSVYAYKEELSKGFITIEGGHRVGVCGKAVMVGKDIKTIKEISSLNIRRCREIIGVSDMLVSRLLDEKGYFLHTIIISPPMCGKTTLLRDIIRNLSGLGLRVGVCDERSEIAGSQGGMPSFDLGQRTDVLDGCPKGEGMLMLIRGMSPNVIATDEIGKKEDLIGIEGALCAGIGLLTTIHGGNMNDLLRSSIGELVSGGVFRRYIFLTNKPKIGTVARVTDELGKKII